MTCITTNLITLFVGVFIGLFGMALIVSAGRGDKDD
jgi:hypothetical protein